MARNVLLLLIRRLNMTVTPIILARLKRESKLTYGTLDLISGNDWHSHVKLSLKVKLQ